MYTSTIVVTDDRTAKEMGSGELPVLATPALVALMENAAMNLAAEFLCEGETTVGSSIEVKHLAPSALGATVSATATLQERDGRRLSFAIEAREGETVVGTAFHTRFIVNVAKFMSKLTK